MVVPAGDAFEGEKAKLLISVTDDWEMWRRVEPYISSCFPMRDVLWIHDLEFRTSVRLKCLDVQWVPESSMLIDRVAQPSLWWRKPFLHVFIAKCEEIASYKDTVQRRLRSWVVEREASAEEYLVIFVPLGSAKSSSAFLYLTSPSSVVTGETATSKIYRKLVDKMRSDIGQSDKVVVFDLSIQGDAGGGTAESAANEARMQMSSLAAKLKECVLGSIGKRLAEYEELIARAHVSERQAEGCDLSAAFTPRDSMALIYKSLGALELAHRQYLAWHEYFDEFMVGRASTFPHFEPRGLAEGSQLAEALDPSSRRPYMELAAGGKLSEFEFRLFVLGREVRLLADGGRLAEAAQLAVKGVGLVASEAEAHVRRGSLSPLFPCSATVCCAEWCARDMHRRIDDSSDFGVQQASAAHCAVAELYLMAARSSSALVEVSPKLKAAYKRARPPSASATPLSSPIPRSEPLELTSAPQLWSEDRDDETVGQNKDRQAVGSSTTAGSKPEVPSQRGHERKASRSWLPATVSSLISGPAHGGVSRALSTLTRFPTAAGAGGITQSVIGVYNRGIASFPFQDSSLSSWSSQAAPSSSLVPPPTAAAPPHDTHTIIFETRSAPSLSADTEEEQDWAIEQMQCGPLLDAVIGGFVEDYSLSLTSAAREHFVQGRRPRFGSLLLVEIARRHMVRERWGEAGELLRYAFEQLVSDSWHVLIGSVYELLCECLERLEEDAARLALSLALLSCHNVPEPYRKRATELLMELPGRLEVEGLVHELGPLVSVALQLPSPPDLPTSHVASAGGRFKGGDDQVEIDLGDGIVLTSNRVLFHDEADTDDEVIQDTPWVAAAGLDHVQSAEPSPSVKSSVMSPPYGLPTPSAAHGQEHQHHHGRCHVVPVGCDLVIECILHSSLACDFSVDALALALVQESPDTSGMWGDGMTADNQVVLETVLEAAGGEHRRMANDLFLLERKDLVLHPGRNFIILRSSMQREGRFMLTALTIRSGKLILAHSLRTHGQVMVEGQRGMPTAQVGLLSGDCIIPGVPALAHLVIRAGEGGIVSPRVRLSGKSDGTSVLKKVRSVIGDTDAGEETIKEVGEDGWTQFPDLEQGQEMTIWFVLLSEGVEQDCDVETHLIFQADLAYSGTQGALYDISRDLRVRKSPSYTVKSRVIPLMYKDDLLQIDVTSMDELHRFEVHAERVVYRGQTLETGQLSQPSSHSIAQGQVVHLLYKIPQTLQQISATRCSNMDCRLEIKSCLTWTDPLLSKIAGNICGDRSITISCSVDDVRDSGLKVTMKGPQRATVGSTICIIFEVEGLKDTVEYKISRTSDWIIGGQVAGVLETRFLLCLIPVKTGLLQLPQIIIDRPFRQIRGSVVVFPSGECCCIQDVDS